MCVNGAAASWCGPGIHDSTARPDLLDVWMHEVAALLADEEAALSDMRAIGRE